MTLDEMFQREQEWRDNLKAGDPVAVWDGWHHSLHKVDRVTTTQIVVGHSKYRRGDGHMIGGGAWSRHSLKEPTPEVIGEMREKADRMALGRIEWSKLPIETVRAVLAVVRAGSHVEGGNNDP